MMYKIMLARTRSNDPEVHKDGCADVKRGLKSGKYHEVHRIDVMEPEDAARWFWEDFLPGGCAYGESGDPLTDKQAQDYTTYLPCTKELKTEPSRQELYDWIDSLNEEKATEVLRWLVQQESMVMKETRKAFTP